jgi:hypothetical protein
MVTLRESWETGDSVGGPAAVAQRVSFDASAILAAVVLQNKKEEQAPWTLYALKRRSYHP